MQNVKILVKMNVMVRKMWRIVTRSTNLVNYLFGLIQFLDHCTLKKLCNNAAIPKRGTENSAGYDLAAAVEVTVPAKGKAVVKIDLAILVPDGCYGRIAPRSGLAVHNHIDIGAGVIDADYRGEVGVVMFNRSDEDFKVRPGGRIAQLILEQIKTPPVKEASELDSTVR